MLDDARFRSLIDNRARHPDRIAELARARRRRPMLGEEGTLFLVAADHPARGVLKAGDRPLAMADRRSLLARLVEALEDADGVVHSMAGLLGHTTSYARRRMSLG